MLLYNVVFLKLYPFFLTFIILLIRTVKWVMSACELNWVIDLFVTPPRFTEPAQQVPSGHPLWQAQRSCQGKNAKRLRTRYIFWGRYETPYIF